MNGIAKILLSVSAIFALPYQAKAIYDENVETRIDQLIVYDSAAIFFSITSTFTKPACATSNYFAIDPSLPADIRAQMLSRLLTAKATNETIHIGYDKTGNCVSGETRTHRVG